MHYRQNQDRRKYHPYCAKFCATPVLFAFLISRQESDRILFNLEDTAPPGLMLVPGTIRSMHSSTLPSLVPTRPEAVANTRAVLHLDKTSSCSTGTAAALDYSRILARRRERRDSLEQEVAESKFAECTFRPRLVAKPRLPGIERGSVPSSSQSVREESFGFTHARDIQSPALVEDGTDSYIGSIYSTRSTLPRGRVFDRLPEDASSRLNRVTARDFQRQAREVIGCSFRPQISAEAQKLTIKEPVTQRLYPKSANEPMDRSDTFRHGSKSVTLNSSARLQAPTQSRPPVISRPPFQPKAQTVTTERNPSSLVSLKALGDRKAVATREAREPQKSENTPISQPGSSSISQTEPGSRPQKEALSTSGTSTTQVPAASRAVSGVSRPAGDDLGPKNISQVTSEIRSRNGDLSNLMKLVMG